MAVEDAPEALPASGFDSCGKLACVFIKKTVHKSQKWGNYNAHPDHKVVLFLFQQLVYEVGHQKW